jgi:glutamine synthetase
MVPNINSYKWFANRGVALTVVAWGLGNRTPTSRPVRWPERRYLTG